MLGKLAAVVLAMGMAVTGCGSGSDNGSDSAVGSGNELTTVRVGVMTGFIEHYLAVLGQEQGIWEGNGLEVEITEFGTGVEAVGAVQSSQIDIAEIMDFGLINRLGNTSGNSNLKIYAINYEGKTDAEDSIAINKFYVDPNEISTTADLAGKSIAVSLGTVSEYMVAKVVESAGLTMDDVTEVPTESLSSVAAVAQNGEINATWASGTTASKLVDMGWTALYADADLGLITRDIGVTSDTYVSDEGLAKYIKARDAVIQYYNENEEEAIRIISEKTAVDEDTVRTTLEGSDLTPEFTAETVDSLTNIKDWALSNKYFEEDFNINDFIDTTELESVFADRVSF
ncbi:MAG: ABC transporter substrate-binding protein [Clostridiaceae bacterium]|nr:ABC transporter substrate-binding protein [Clostridiaceae bacterium]